MPYIGNTVQTQGFTPAIDYFNGNGVTVTFTLTRPVASVAQMIVAIDNVIQNPSSSFTVAGNAITFTSAPLSGTNNIWVEYTSLITTYAAISQDPTVIGDITTNGGGFLSTGDFGNSYIAGTIVDYVTGTGRVTVGPSEAVTLYNGGSSGRNALLTANSTGVGVGMTPVYKFDVTGGNGNAIRYTNSADGVQVGMGAYNSTGFFGTLNNFPQLFYTNGAERMRLNTTGALVLAGGSTSANGIGITFPATQVPSADANTLDDYEEGTYTPVFSFTTTNGNLTYDSVYGRYTKVGDIVNATFYVGILVKGTASGDCRITLPFTSKNASGNYQCGAVWIGTATGTSGGYMVYCAPNEALARFQYSQTGTQSNFTSSNCQNATGFMVNITYSVG